MRIKGDNTEEALIQGLAYEATQFYRGYFHVSLFTSENQGDSPSQKEHHLYCLSM